MAMKINVTENIFFFINFYGFSSCPFLLKLLFRIEGRDPWNKDEPSLSTVGGLGINGLKTGLSLPLVLSNGKLLAIVLYLASPTDDLGQVWLYLSDDCLFTGFYSS